MIEVNKKNIVALANYSVIRPFSGTMFETEHDNWENVQEPRSQGEKPGNEVECCAVRVARARATS